MVEWRPEVEVGNVKARKPCMGGGKHAVELEFDEFKGTCPGARVTGVAYSVAANGDSGAVGVFFLGPYFTQDSSVGNIAPAVCWDVAVQNGEEDVSAVDSLCSRGHGVWSKSLTETSEFGGVGCVQGLLVGKMPP